MAIACKCDRCGKFFNLKNDGINTKIFLDCTSYSTVCSYDLCDECVADFNNWMNVCNKIDTVNKEESE